MTTYKGANSGNPLLTFFSLAAQALFTESGAHNCQEAVENFEARFG